MLLCEDLPDSVRTALLDIQNDLFDLGGELCLPGMEVIRTCRSPASKNWPGNSTTTLPMLKGIHPPQRHPRRRAGHLSRTVCRRAERAVVRLHAAEPLSGAARRYINRLPTCCSSSGAR